MTKKINHFYEFGPFRVDASRQLLLRDGQLVSLPPKTFQTLLVLLQHSEKMVSKDELMKQLWPDTFVEESNLTYHISMLRKALGESPQDRRYLVTMPGSGYRFAEKVREVSDGCELMVESHSMERVTFEETETRGERPAVISLARFSRRPWNWILGTAAGVCVIFLVRANFGLASRPAGSFQARAEMKLRQLTTNPSENPVNNGAISPDGKYLAYTDANGMHIKLLETGETRTVPAPESLKGKDVEWRIIQQWFPDSTRFLADAHPAGESPAFWSSQGSSIWTLSVLGGPPRKLRDEATAYSISPDGSSISFGTNKGTLGDREIWLMGADGENARKLFGADENGAMCCLRWFPHGQRVWFATNNRPGGDLVTSDLNGGPVTSILPWSILKKSWEFTLLPDSHLLYLVAESGAVGTSCNYWALPLDEQTGAPADQPRQLTNWSGYCPVNTSVTADGKKLAFLKWIGRNSVHMAELEANGNQLADARRFASSESLNIPLDWTEDSKELIYVSNRNGHFEILKQSLDSETAEPLVIGPNDNADARVSPDGAWLIYSVTTLDNLRESLQIMRVPLSGGPSQLVLIASPFSEFRCARSPSTLCVLAERAGNRKEFIMTAFDPVKGRGAELARIDIHNEAKKFHWDLSPDGARLCFTRNPRGPIETLSVDNRATQTIPVKDWNNLESLDWDAEGEGFFVGSGVHGGMVLLHVDLQGRAHVLQKIPGSAALFARPSPDGRHLAFHEMRIEGNIWSMENF